MSWEKTSTDQLGCCQDATCESWRKDYEHMHKPHPWVPSPMRKAMLYAAAICFGLMLLAEYYRRSSRAALLNMWNPSLLHSIPSTQGRRNNLFAVKTAATCYERRRIIRQTWAKSAKTYPLTDVVFYIGKTNAATVDSIRSEIDEFGDIAVLGELEETHDIATSVKSTTFFKRLVDQSEHQWNWVMHIDDDTYLNIPLLMESYLSTQTFHALDVIQSFGIIGRKLQYSGHNLSSGEYAPYPAGPFYGVTWPLLEILSQTRKYIPGFEIDGSFWADDDVMVGMVIHNSNITDALRATWLSNYQAYNLWYNQDTETDDQSFGFHQGCLHSETIAAHGVKKNSNFIWAASHFDDKGNWQARPDLGGSDKCDRLNLPTCTCLPPKPG